MTDTDLSSLLPEQEKEPTATPGAEPVAEIKPETDTEVLTQQVAALAAQQESAEETTEAPAAAEQTEAAAAAAPVAEPTVPDVAEAAPAAPEVPEVPTPAPAAAEPELPTRVAEKHAQKKRHPVLKTLLIIVLCLIVAGGAGAAYLYYHDQQMADVIPDGVTFQQTSFGGMTKSEVDPKVTTILGALGAQEISLQVPGTETTQAVPVKNFVSFDTTSVVSGITQARSQMSLIARLRSDWLNQSVARTIPLSYTVNQQAVSSYVAALAKKADVAPVDAKLTLPQGSLVPTVTPEVVGATVNVTATTIKLNEAIKTAIDENSTQSITVAATANNPKVTAASLEDAPSIVVALGAKRMSLYRGSKLIRSMVTATGAPQYATRPGDYFIGVKRYNPTWINPGDAWAKSMPAEIGPGPGNPLGPRAMNVDQRNSKGQIVDFGYRIHAGTTGGGAWSHGCLHLTTSDVLWLYDQVKVGTPVFIRP